MSVLKRKNYDGWAANRTIYQISYVFLMKMLSSNTWNSLVFILLMLKKKKTMTDGMPIEYFYKCLMDF